MSLFSSRWVRVCASTLALAFTAAAQPALAQAWPSKPVRFIVPYPPGSGTDIMARRIGQRLGERLGQSFVVDNRAGAGGSIGTEAIARAPADGYTIGIVDAGALAINPAIYPKLGYDTQRDLRIRIVNPTPRRADRSTAARLDLPGATVSGDGQRVAAGPWMPRVGVFGERQRAGIARLTSAGTRLPGVVRGGRWTVGVTKRCVDRARTRVPAGRGGRSHPPRRRRPPIGADRGRVRCGVVRSARRGERGCRARSGRR